MSEVYKGQKYGQNIKDKWFLSPCGNVVKQLPKLGWTVIDKFDKEQFIYQKGELVEKPEYSLLKKKLIKNKHIDFLNQPFNINGFSFYLDSQSLNDFKSLVSEAEGIGLTTIFSRDANNKYFSLTIDKAKQYLKYLFLAKTMSFINKWQLEKVIEANPNNEINIEVNKDELVKLSTMTSLELETYIKKVAGNFII